MSAGSRCSGLDGRNTVPPPSHTRRATQCPAPCMNGGVIERLATAGPATASSTKSATVRAVGEPPKHSTMASPLRHSTPLGMPVVPPV